MALVVGGLLVASLAVLITPSPLGVADTTIGNPLAFHHDAGYSPDALMDADADADADGESARFLVKRAAGQQMQTILKCFGVPKWIDTSMRTLMPTKKTAAEQTQFFIATRRNRERREIPTGSKFTVSAIPWFDARLRTVVIVHGFQVANGMDWMQDMASAILDQNDVNVITVYWKAGNNLATYWKAVSMTPVAGADLLQFMTQMINEAGLRKDDVHLVGHSLGAHICGFVSRSLLNVSRITGLDPVVPCFKDPRHSLQKSDAAFVDVIHTNGKMVDKDGLDGSYSIGHVDFYPNGGMLSTECDAKTQKKPTWLSWLWRLVHKKSYKLSNEIREAICSHGRAYALFTESLRQAPGCFFWGHPWDMRAATLAGSLDRKCDMDHCSEMGYDSDRYRARGGFFVKATDAPPFCVPDPRTNTEMTHLSVAVTSKTFDQTTEPSVAEKTALSSSSTNSPIPTER